MNEPEQIEQYRQELKEFLSKPLWSWVKSQYLLKQNKKLEYLLSHSLKDNLSEINIIAGEIKGFKEAMELIDNLTKGGKDNAG
jgi:hypothetical protein